MTLSHSPDHFHADAEIRLSLSCKNVTGSATGFSLLYKQPHSFIKHTVKSNMVAERGFEKRTNRLSVCSEHRRNLLNETSRRNKRKSTSLQKKINATNATRNQRNRSRSQSQELQRHQQRWPNRRKPNGQRSQTSCQS